MKLSTKMNALVGGALLVFVIVAGLLSYAFIITQQLDEMQEQTTVVLKEVYHLTDESKRLILSEAPLEDLLADWDHVRENFATNLAALRTHPARRWLSAGVNDRLEQTVEVWNRNKTLLDTARSDLQGILELDGISDTYKRGVDRMLDSSAFDRLERKETYKTIETVRINLTQVDNQAHNYLLPELEELRSQIRAQTDGIRRQILFALIAVVALAAIATFVVTLRFARRLSGRIRSIEEATDRIAQKDLSVRLHDHARDEIGMLSGHLNNALAELGSLIGTVRAASTQVNELKDALASNSSESASAVNQISQNIDSINRQFGELDQRIADSHQSLVEIGDQVQHLASSIEQQSSSLNQASASIEEMSASIDNVAELSNQRKERADELLRVMQNTGDQVGNTNETITEVAQKIDDVLEVIEIINTIAEQTNLLSMNAAIESAHAGEAGKGFAVVAEEIRKLAESSSENADRIDEALRAVTGKIREASSSSQQSQEAMDQMTSDVRTFADAMTEISQTMDELRQGSSEIAQSSQEITQLTSGIQGDATTIRDNTGQIREAMEDARNISANLRNGMQEIDNGSKEILDSVNQMSQVSEESKERIQELHEAVALFKTEAEGPAQEERQSDRQGEAH